jgi:phage nucleotide-binding protein
MALKFSKASEVSTHPPVIVLYSAPGVGKTTCVSNIVDPKNPDKTLIVDLDGSASVIERVCPEANVVTIDSFKDMEELIHMFHVGNDRVKSVRNLVLDTLTEGEDVCLWDSMEAKGKKIPEMSNYNERYSVMRQFIRDLKLLPVNVIVVCHEMELELEEDNLFDLGTSIKINRKMPKLSGKMSSALVGSADIVLRLCIQEDVDPETGKRIHSRVFQTAKTDRVWAKDRTGCLPEVMPADLRKVLLTWHKVNAYSNKQREESDA